MAQESLDTILDRSDVLNGGPAWSGRLHSNIQHTGVRTAQYTSYLTDEWHSSELVSILLCAVCLVLDITEIILFAKHSLQPLTYLVFQCVKTTIWFILFVIVLAQSMKEQQSELGYVQTGLDLVLDGLVEAVLLL